MTEVEHEDAKNIIRAMPKAELHVHLEGTVRPETLLDLSRENGVEIPPSSVEEVRDYYRFRDFSHFIEIWIGINRCLARPEDFERIVWEYGETASEQNIRDAEVTLTPWQHSHYRGIRFDDLLDAINRGRERVRAEWNVEIQWVPDHPRDEPDEAWKTVEMAIEGRDRGVVALGLGGSEQKWPPELFADVFDAARRAGLKSVPHAGEAAGPESVWGALESLGADRIGHGIRSIEDKRLVEHLRKRQIPLEVSITSNVRTGVVDDLGDHPVRRLFDAGVPITLNTDDPSMFGTTLNEEYLLAYQTFGFRLTELAELSLNAVRYSFLSARRKSEMLDTFRHENAKLRP